MKTWIHAVLFAAALLPFTFGTVSAAEFSAPGQLADTFIAAFNAGDTEGVKSTCAEIFWTSSSDNPQKLIRQGYGKARAFFLRLSKLTEASNRAAAVFDVLSARTGEKGDTIFLYAEKKEKSWLFYGLNEDTIFMAKFLEGVVDGGFHPKNLPESPELAALSSGILTHFAETNTETTFEEFREQYREIFTVPEAAKKAVHFLLFQPMTKPMLLETKWAETLGRGSVTISDTESAENPFPDRVVLYFRKTETGWELYNTSSFLSLSSFLE